MVERLIREDRIDIENRGKYNEVKSQIEKLNKERPGDRAKKALSEFVFDDPDAPAVLLSSYL